MLRAICRKLTLKAKGFGLLKIQHVLPEHFELVEGSNAVAGFVAGSKTIQIFYKAIPTKRGIYDLNRIVFGSENPLMTDKKRWEIKTGVGLETRQKICNRSCKLPCLLLHLSRIQSWSLRSWSGLDCVPRHGKKAV